MGGSTSPPLSSGPQTPSRRTRQPSPSRSLPTGSSRVSSAGISRPSTWATSTLMSRANPWVGDYAIDRHVNWNLSKPEYIFNWVGKSEFKTGPFSSFSPIDTKIDFNFNSRQMMLNADMVETMGGKQWGLKIHRNRFSLLTGVAA